MVADAIVTPQGAQFDGTGDWINASANPQLGTGDVTVMAWVYAPSITNNPVIVSQGDTGSTEWMLRLSSDGNFQLYAAVSFIFNIAGTFTGKWHLLGFVRSSGTTQAYVDGLPVGSASSTSWNSASGKNPQIGGADSVATRAFTGKIDAVVIAKMAMAATLVRLYFERTRGRYGV